MATIASLKVNILGDSTALSASLKQATDKMQAFGDKATSIGQTLSTRLTLPIVGAGALMVNSFMKQEDAVAKMTAALRANGGQAGTTAKEIQDLASNLQKVTTFGDEVTISAASLLLTFHQVRNEVGEGNDVFNRTIKASQDLASVLGIDLQSATMQLAKALENPTIGLGALSRSGTTFTEQQKEQIKTLVASGRQLEAQTMILDVVESQYAGIAESMRKTTSGTIKAAVNELGDEMEAFGKIISESLIPFIARLTDVVRYVASLDDNTKRLIVSTMALVAAVGPAILAIGLLTKGLVALTVSMTTATGPIGMLIAAMLLLGASYAMHKTILSDNLVATKTLANTNKTFALALTTTAEEMKVFADESGRTADELDRVNVAMAEMVKSAEGRVKALENQIFSARVEIEKIIRTGQGNIFTGYGEDNSRVKELRKEIVFLQQALDPLYQFLVKSKDGLDGFATSAGTTKAQLTELGTEVVTQAGSIGALTAELQGLQAQFEATGSGAERVNLANQITELEHRLKVLRSVLTPVTTELKMLKDEFIDDSNGFMGSEWDSQYEGVKIVTTQMKLLGEATFFANEMAYQFTNQFSAGLANLIVHGGKVKDMLRNIGNLLASSALQLGIQMLLMGSTGQGGAFGLIKGLFGRSVMGGDIGGVTPASASLTLDGQFQIRGTDLVYVMNRAERSLR